MKKNDFWEKLIFLIIIFIFDKKLIFDKNFYFLYKFLFLIRILIFDKKWSLTCNYMEYFLFLTTRRIFVTTMATMCRYSSIGQYWAVYCLFKLDVNTHLALCHSPIVIVGIKQKRKHIKYTKKISLNLHCDRLF